LKLAALLIAFSLYLSGSALAQRPDFTALLETLDSGGTALHEQSGVTLTAADYEVDGRHVEAILFSPRSAGQHAGLLLIPGFSTSARDWVSNGIAFAVEGYTCLAVTQPGFGKSDGPADFVGPVTIHALSSGLDLLKQDPSVDPEQLGIVGYSRGAMAAALLATQRSDIGAVVLGAGVYDFQAAYDEITSEGIRANMAAESGMTPEAIAERSAVRHVERLTAPVLILHGDQDLNAPVSQAYLLRDRLTELGKDFEIEVFTGAEHSIGIQNFRSYSLDFLGRRLGDQKL
jgi:dipeptidyl aminopeptidase/acylaminoacyl peptidase